MSVTTKSSKTNAFVERSVIISWTALILIILAGLTSQFFSKQVMEKTVTLSPKETVTLAPINLKNRLIGALRIDVKAMMPTNHWVVYEIQLYDDQNQLLASARKEAWRESGVWREGGETGTWSEADLLGGLDVQLSKKQQEEITIAVSVLEYGETAGLLVQEKPVSFQVDVKNGVIDTRYLGIGFLGTLVMAIVTTLSVEKTGKVKIRKTAVHDNHVGEHAIMGGTNKLIRVTVQVLYYETSSQFCTVNLWIKHGVDQRMAKQVYNKSTQIKLKFDNKLLSQVGENRIARGKLDQDLIVDQHGDYQFDVAVIPEQPVLQTSLVIKEF